MLDGLSYLIGQVALLLLIAMALGVVLGRLAWPRQPDAAPGGSASPGWSASPGAPDPAELRQELEQARAQINQLHQRLATADTEVLRMRAHAQSLADEKETEMGRLESGAIVALESTMQQHQEQVARLEFRLREAEETARNTERMLDTERRRTAQLQSALAERDQHVATLSADLADRNRADTPPRSEPGTST